MKVFLKESDLSLQRAEKAFRRMSKMNRKSGRHGDHDAGTYTPYTPGGQVVPTYSGSQATGDERKRAIKLAADAFDKMQFKAEQTAEEFSRAEPQLFENFRSIVMEAASGDPDPYRDKIDYSMQYLFVTFADGTILADWSEGRGVLAHFFLKNGEWVSDSDFKDPHKDDYENAADIITVMVDRS